MDIAVAALTIAGLLLAGWLGHHLGSEGKIKEEVRAERRRFYLEWLRFLDRLPVQIVAAIRTDDSQSRFLREMWSRLADIRTEVEFVASPAVGRAWNEVHDKLRTDELTELYLQKTREGVRVDIAMHEAYSELVEHSRHALLNAMRTELGFEELPPRPEGRDASTRASE